MCLCIAAKCMCVCVLHNVCVSRKTYTVQYTVYGDYKCVCLLYYYSAFVFGKYVSTIWVYTCSSIGPIYTRICTWLSHPCKVRHMLMEDIHACGRHLNLYVVLLLFNLYFTRNTTRDSKSLLQEMTKRAAWKVSQERTNNDKSSNLRSLCCSHGDEDATISKVLHLQ